MLCGDWFVDRLLLELYFGEVARVLRRSFRRVNTFWRIFSDLVRIALVRTVRFRWKCKNELL